MGGELARAAAVTNLLFVPLPQTPGLLENVISRSTSTTRVVVEVDACGLKATMRALVKAGAGSARGSHWLGSR